MANDFSKISSENAIREQARISAEEGDFYGAAGQDEEGGWEVEIAKNPFQLTAEDLAPGGFVHRD